MHYTYFFNAIFLLNGGAMKFNWFSLAVVTQSKIVIDTVECIWMFCNV